jgi:tripartite ATP-independent transporter DctM subunit
MMPWYDLLAIMTAAITVLILVGVPVVFAFLATNLIVAFLLMGGKGGIILIIANATQSVTLFVLVTIPMFLLMGELFFRTRMVVRVFDAFEMLLGEIRGRLAYLTIATGTMFAALIGSNMASTAMLGSLMTGEMGRRGYKPYVTMGSIMGAGGLAMIIPPSGLAVLLGSLASVDVAALLIAGVGPGLVLATLYLILVWVQVRLDPEAAPSYAVKRPPGLLVVRAFALNVLPMAGVIFCVVGSMLLGWATPTESGAFGAAAVIVLAAVMRCLTWKALFDSFAGAMRSTGAVYMIFLGSATFAQVMAFTGASSGLAEAAAHLDVAPLVMLFVMFGVLLVLGSLMEGGSILVLTVPIFYPIAKALGFDLIWFSWIVMLSMEISALHPPFGISLFIMLGVAPRGTTFGSVVIASLPYLACQFILVGLLVAFPKIALYLPSLMK